jgi:hypothetical protein
MHMYVNGKMVSVEIMPGMEEGGNEGEWWWCEFKYDIFDIL